MEVILPNDMLVIIFGFIDHDVLPLIRVNKNTHRIIEKMLGIVNISHDDYKHYAREMLFNGKIGVSAIIVQRMIDIGDNSVSFAYDLVCLCVYKQSKQRAKFAKMCIRNSVTMSEDITWMVTSAMAHDNDILCHDIKYHYSIDSPSLLHNVTNWMLDLGYGPLVASLIPVVDFMVTSYVWMNSNDDVRLLRRLFTYRNCVLDAYVHDKIGSWIDNILDRNLSILASVYRFTINVDDVCRRSSMLLLIYSLTRMGIVPKRRRRKLPIIHEEVIDVPELGLMGWWGSVKYNIAIEIRKKYPEQKIVFKDRIYNNDRVYIKVNVRVITVFAE